jgi:ADP-heptose:LPS heptosyltransferase
MQTFLPDIPARKWQKNIAPRRVLAIRLQAMGDVVITLPYLQNLRNTLPPDTDLDLLTREEVESIPKNINLFDHVYSIGGGRNWKKQLILTYLLLPKLLLRRYDVVIDLQNNIISKTIRKALMPKAWSEFDRFSPIAAGECTRLSIEAAGFKNCAETLGFKTKISNSEITGILKQNGWDGKSKLVLLNPAGAFKTRHWPIEHYIEFSRIWTENFPHSQFLVVGTNFISSKASYLKQNLNNKLINLVGKTSPVQAFSLLQKIQLVISEDSGLMHMAWVSGIPTLAIFGSTRSDRATPLGNHTLLLNSSDLPCGNCMLEACRFGDNHCVTRYSPSFVFEKAVSLLKSLQPKISSYSAHAEIINDNA